MKKSVVYNCFAGGLHIDIMNTLDELWETRAFVIYSRQSSVRHVKLQCNRYNSIGLFSKQGI